MYVFVAIDVTGVPFPTTSSLKENENIIAYERKCSQPTLFLLIVNFTKLVLDFKSVFDWTTQPWLLQTRFIRRSRETNPGLMHFWRQLFNTQLSWYSSVGRAFVCGMLIPSFEPPMAAHRCLEDIRRISGKM